MWLFPEKFPTDIEFVIHHFSRWVYHDVLTDVKEIARTHVYDVCVV